MPRSTHRPLRPANAGFALAAAALALASPAMADDAAPPPPCSMPAAVALADRPGTGRTASSGGSPCVVLPGEVVIESGLRRQITLAPGGSTTLASGPLTFVRIGLTRRLELGIAPPTNQARSAVGTTAADAAHGFTDVVVAAKYLVLDTATVQASGGLAYSAPTGTGEFTAGAPAFSASANLGIALTPKLSLATSQVLGTALGADATGANRPYFVWSPSFTLAYALDGNDTLLLQDALVSRQGPVLPAGSRGFLAFQRALGSRLAVDIDYERNFAPTLGTQAFAFGLGFVWIAARGR